MAKKSNLLDALEQLDIKDIYSLILFALYRLKDDPKYSTLGELIYLLDNESFARFINFFGGTTLSVPTIDEIRGVLNAIVFYERQVNTNLSETDILKELGIVTPAAKAEMYKALETVAELLQEYDFKRV